MGGGGGGKTSTHPGKPKGRPPPSDGNLKECPPFEKIEKILIQLSFFSQPIIDLNLK